MYNIVGGPRKAKYSVSRLWIGAARIQFVSEINDRECMALKKDQQLPTH